MVIGAIGDNLLLIMLLQICYSEPISKLLKIVKAPSLQSDKGSVFGCYLAGSRCKLPFTALCE